MRPHLDQSASPRSRVTQRRHEPSERRAQDDAEHGAPAERQRAQQGDESTTSGRPHRPSGPGMGVGDTVAFVVVLIAIVVVVALL